MSEDANGVPRPKRGRGRPRGAPNLKPIVQRVARQPVTMVRAGEPVRVSAAEAVLWTLLQKAGEGDLPAKKLADELRGRYAPEAEPTGGLLVVPEGDPIDRYLRLAEYENQFAEPPPGYLEAVKSMADPRQAPPDEPGVRLRTP